MCDNSTSAKTPDPVVFRVRQAEVQMVTSPLRLPDSAGSRSQRGHLRLLASVDLHAPTGLQFRGRLLRAGGRFDPDDLPRPAVLLEHAGSVRIAAAPSRYSWENLWVLWRFDFRTGSWVEVVRAVGRDSAWTTDFAPIAHRLLYPPLQPGMAAELRARPVVEQLAGLIDEHLDGVTREVRCYVLAELERHVAGHIVRASEYLRRSA